MSPTRAELVKWLATKEVKGKTLDIGGEIWSIRGKVKSFAFDGFYETLDEHGLDLNSQKEAMQRTEIPNNLKRVGFFDNIFCTEVMQFIYNPFNALDNMAALISPWGGKLYISFHLTHPLMKGHDYLRYTEKGIRKLLEETGFEIVEFIEPLPGYFLVECSRQS